MRMSFKTLVLMIGMLFTHNLYAAGLVTDDNSNSSYDQSADQSQGNYQSMNLGYAGFGSIGMFQEAWQDPLQNLGEGQSKPAYSKYYWTPDLVLPVRLREGMITMINFPEWELVEHVFVGDTGTFTGQIMPPNTVMLYPQPGATVGNDTNVIVLGRSGNKYVFYARSEGINTERITNSIIDIDVVGKNGASGGSPRSGGEIAGGSSGHVNAAGFGAGMDKTVDATFTRRFLKEDWLKSIPMDPSKFRFDIEIYVPNPDDVIIAPERVWHDDIFTYIDLGEKAINMVQRPIVTMIIERSETPVGFRTKGPNNRLIIVEGVGDMVMRSGKRMVCLKMRRSDDEGTQYVSYADTSNEWDIAPAIPGQGSQSGGSSSAGMGAGAVSSTSSAASGTDKGSSGTDGRTGFGNNSGGGVYVPNGAISGSNSSMNGLMGAVCAPNNGCAGDMDYSGMSQLKTADGAVIGKNFPQYKYGSGFEGQTSDSLSIELGTDSNVNNLEALWQDLSGRYSSLLSGYEPFYSVDTPADGQGKELFHLRVGPIKSLDSGDSVCSQLGRNGVFCSVVRVQ
ncbi:MAG: TrbG/VirB9 family P-type conjugative transfer protein [Alphaproteobacteria bacterium]|nr:TrbG/VirB9 family P-type conjugative transfer protein [Alphaproteobacteria bacterium]